MKKHKKADVSSNINPVPMTQTTNKMYGLLALAALLLGVTTLGSIGDGVDGSTEKNNSMNQMNRKKCEYIQNVAIMTTRLTQCFSGDNCHKIGCS